MKNTPELYIPVAQEILTTHPHLAPTIGPRQLAARLAVFVRRLERTGELLQSAGTPRPPETDGPDWSDIRAEDLRRLVMSRKPHRPHLGFSQ